MSALTHFLERKNVPVQQNQVHETQTKARAIARGDLRMAVCEVCGFVMNTAFMLERLHYDETYDNTQTYSSSFSEHTDKLIRRVAEAFQDGQVRIVEVGCGKGTFLRKLVEAMPGATGYGFDTSYIGPMRDLDGRIRFFQRYYEPDDADIDPTLIICRHVIEHVPDPVRLLRNIRQTLRDGSSVKLYFETPCIEWILENYVIWDLFYEHCSYFSSQTLRMACEESGFEVASVEHVFGGQYLWLEASLSQGNRETPKMVAGRIPELARQFAQTELQITGQLAARMRSFSTEGKIALWGAGAKGVTLANLLDPDREWITCIVDINPHKQGKYLSGSGHPIVNYHQLPKLGVITVFNMNSNYLEENHRLLNEAKIDLRLLDLEDWIQETK